VRRFVSWCVDGLPFDSRSRRAIDETLTDWALEERDARSRTRRALASVLGLLSIVRVVSFSLVREAADFGWRRGLARRCGMAVGLVAAMSLVTALPMLHGLGVKALALALLNMPLSLLAFLPPAIFLMFAWRPVGRAAPGAGAACFLAVATLLLAGWIVPASSDLTLGLLQSMGSLLTTDSAPRLSPAEAALAVTGWAVVAGASALCAAAVAARGPLRSRWWLAGVPAIYAALVPVFTMTIGSSFLVFRGPADPPEGFAPGLAAWTTAALLVAAATTYRRAGTQGAGRRA
jgi:hypothetical protein